MPINPEYLQPGDVLLYGGSGLFNRIIQVKTWSRYSHVEIYDGRGESLASRNGIGVGRYPSRLDDCLAIYRLRVPFSVNAGRGYFAECEGEPYDWWGLLAFTSAKWQGKENKKQFCSEFAARYLRRAIGAAADVRVVGTGESEFNPEELALVRKGNAKLLADVGLDPWNGYDADGLAPGEFTKSALLYEVQA